MGKAGKGSFKRAFGESFKEEFDLVVELEGYKIHGHLDCLVVKEKEVIGIELKAPKMLILREPYNEGALLVDDGRVLHNEVYLTQARIEKALLELLFPDKEVKMYLFYKALCKHKEWSKKLYVVSEVKESASPEEIKELLRRFYEDKSPRYPNECVSYCIFYKEGLCEAKEYIQHGEQKLSSNILNALKHYRALQSDLKTRRLYLRRLSGEP